MPDKKNNLFIYEAIELMQEYDKHIKVLENLNVSIQRNLPYSPLLKGVRGMSYIL